MAEFLTIILWYGSVTHPATCRLQNNALLNFLFVLQQRNPLSAAEGIFCTALSQKTETDTKMNHSVIMLLVALSVIGKCM